jgi:hypothetical protein
MLRFVAPPTGGVGNFTVGEAVGFGGRLIRTVSFLGWILDASAGFCCSELPPIFGKFSAIT